jgi:hypothetical protein
VVLGEVGNFLAYGFAPAILVAPLGTVALISNAVIAPLLLKEAFKVKYCQLLMSRPETCWGYSFP